MPAGPDAPGHAPTVPPRLAPLRWWHLEQCAALDRILFGPDVWSAETFWAELAAPGRWYVAALAGDPPDGDERVLGYAGIAVTGTEADVQTVAVAPAARGTGLGRRLLDALTAEAAHQQVTTMLLEVRADNTPAITLYRSAGFEQIAIRRRYYQPGDIDALVMRLRPVRGGPTGTVAGPS